MESRRLYREIEEAAETGRFSQDEHPHTFLSRALRHRYRAYRDTRESLYAYFVATSAMVSHPSVKIDFAKSVHSDLWDAAFSSLPYIEAQNRRTISEREAGVALYNEASKDLEEIGRRFMAAFEEKNPPKDPNKIDI